VRFILSRTDAPGPASGNSVAPEHWPIVIGLVARQFVLMAKDTLDPRISLRLIIASSNPSSEAYRGLHGLDGSRRAHSRGPTVPS
jgi:hypothetical protein